MTAQLDLLSVIPECVLPGCREKVDEHGEVCAGCLAVFAEEPGGWRLVATGGPPMTEEAIAERDEAVADAYRQQAAVEVPVDTREWKANQLCWICDERRKCALVDHDGWDKRWECRACQEIV